MSANTPLRRRGRHTLLATLLVVVTMLLSACGGASRGGDSTVTTVKLNEDAPAFADNSTMATIQQRGKLLVGVVPNSAPFSSQNSNTGSWEGFDIEVARQVAISLFGEDIEDRIQWIPLAAIDREAALQQRRIDMMVGRYVITVPRKNFVDFAGPYYNATQDVIVARRTSVNRDTAITTFAQLNGRKVCVAPSSTNIDALKAAVPQADLSNSQTTLADCAAQLSSGAVDAIAAEHVDLLAVAASLGTGYTTLKAQYGTQPYGIGVTKDVTDWRSHLNGVLEEWSDYRSAYTATTGDSAVTKPAVDRY